MIIFINEDEAYLHWISVNPTGFVVNAKRRPDSSYLKLHYASCGYVSSAARTNWTTNQYIKICSSQVEELAAWVNREVGGELDRGCSCNGSVAQSKLMPSIPIHLDHDCIVAGKPWNLWQPKEELISIQLPKPLKASWEASAHPNQQRLREYREQIQTSVAHYLSQDRLYLRLDVGFSDYRKMLSGNDLENYLTPLFEYSCLPSNRFRMVMATKRLADESRLSIGVAQECEPRSVVSSHAYTAMIPVSLPSKEKEFKLEIEKVLQGACPAPLPAGEVDVHIALQRPLSIGRSWHTLWKSIGDAMGPVLGFYERQNRFDPCDDRITSLTLHLCPDESMGRNVRIGYWWRCNANKVSG